MLLDMGGEYHCYGADITCSYPANGRFSEKQKIMYNAVLAAQLAVFAAMKPGVMWTDMHALSLRTILTELTRHGILHGDVDEMMDADLGVRRLALTSRPLLLYEHHIDSDRAWWWRWFFVTC